jgi:steroid 5-alpha reductase family enzyme
MLRLFFIETIVVSVYMMLWFLIALRLRKNDVADIAWGGGYIVAALVVLAMQDTVTDRELLVSLLVAVWGVRLAVHIGLRNRGKGEDPRYRQWREEWGRHAMVRSFFQVFLLQGLLIVVISLPVTRIILSEESRLSPLDLIGVLVWLMGFLFEAIGDYQLMQFKKDPATKGKIMTTGLWKYTRHPNYFGEVTLWWGIYLIALAVPGGWATIIGPITITFLILGVSGIPLLEKKYEGNREFDEYKRHTSAFFPMLPKA